jgi:CheY-like chemotaxis protein
MLAPSPDLPRILIAEHDQSVADLLQAFLKGEGYQPSLAPSLESALECLDEQVFHVVLTDLFVDNPRRPFSRVRRLLQRSPPTPVGLMTGWQITPEEAERQGFAFLLQKPFDLDRMLAEIAAVLHPALTPEQERQLQAVERCIEALKVGNLERLGQLLAEDLTYYPPEGVPAKPRRVKGSTAMLAYIQEAYRRYQHVNFDEFLFYPRPKGWAVRFRSRWPAPGGSRQSLTGALLFHFQGEQIHQVGIRWNSERLQALLSAQQGQPHEPFSTQGSACG